MHVVDLVLVVWGLASIPAALLCGAVLRLTHERRDGAVERARAVDIEVAQLRR